MVTLHVIPQLLTAIDISGIVYTFKKKVYLVGNGYLGMPKVSAYFRLNYSVPDIGNYSNTRA